MRCFSYIYAYSGKNVLGQKSELQIALEKHKRAQNQKEIEQQKNSCRTPFERMIEERAKKIETVFIYSPLSPLYVIVEIKNTFTVLICSTYIIVIFIIIM